MPTRIERILSRLRLRFPQGALYRFNFWTSLRRTWLSTLRLLAGASVPGSADRPTILTFSIFETHARLWLHFVRRALAGRDWDVVIVDCSGTFRPEMLSGARVIRLFNWSHGRKIDLVLERLRSDLVFLLDDDRYLLDAEAIDRVVPWFESPKVAAASLIPRHWWKLRIAGRDHFPMGAYGVVVRRPVIVRLGLSFRTRNEFCASRVDAAGVQARRSYDTGDFAHEQLLRLGYDVPSLEPRGRAQHFARPVDESHDSIVGFDGASGGRLAATWQRATSIPELIAGATSLAEDSFASYFFKSSWSDLCLDDLFASVFGERARPELPFSRAEILGALRRNANADSDQIDALERYAVEVEEISSRLLAVARSIVAA